ncbi:NAD(P)/FAD-dependent oxidoreductase [Dokdonia sp. Hel_I_53]|uniref:NAD(P)/FAD-dependent oxidoreductase n=1 Tax=Dokdonia sp. Hel_I_53 TaxID=1566287 RepID=UPI00119C6980|nr:NAD(P)/FAD-dependent oxidoreductase [Dokdonia sp. Hel_I_53]TVZ52068.1 NADH dehydrogenase [Dokdonia sp. Hel_I_53]
MSNQLNIPKSIQKRIVIVGGGFAGLNVAKGLLKANAQIVLIDRYNFHTFQPLLYQAATSALPATSVVYPFREILNKSKSFYYRWAEVTGVDTHNKVLKCSEGDLMYDTLILATGTEVNFFGNSNIEKFSMPMKSLPQAIKIRQTILNNFEKADRCDDVIEKKALLNFCIAGGGPTGVEVSGALAEMKNEIFPRDYPHLDTDLMEIHLFEGSERLLGSMSEHAGKKALASLKNLGVILHLETEVNDYDGRKLYTSQNKEYSTENFIWAAGVVGKPLEGIPDTSVGKAKRYIVDNYNAVKNCKDIYAIGDIALMKTNDFPEGHPQVAQPAIQQGDHLAKNLARAINGKEMKTFRYFEKGYMAVVGRNKAVADIGKFQFSGFVAWLLWSFIHLFSLAGFKNRLIVFVSWIYNYINGDKSTRVIIQEATENKS